MKKAEVLNLNEKEIHKYENKYGADIFLSVFDNASIVSLLSPKITSMLMFDEIKVRKFRQQPSSPFVVYSIQVGMEHLKTD